MYSGFLYSHKRKLVVSQFHFMFERLVQHPQTFRLRVDEALRATVCPPEPLWTTTNLLYRLLLPLFSTFCQDSHLGLSVRCHDMLWEILY